VINPFIVLMRLSIALRVKKSLIVLLRASFVIQYFFILVLRKVAMIVRKMNFSGTELIIRLVVISGVVLISHLMLLRVFVLVAKVLRVRLLLFDLAEELMIRMFVSKNLLISKGL